MGWKFDDTTNVTTVTLWLIPMYKAAEQHKLVAHSVSCGSQI